MTGALGKMSPAAKRSSSLNRLYLQSMTRIRATGSAAEAQQQAAERLEEFFARCQDELLGTLYYLVGNVEDARDALQEAFVKCWQHRADVPGIENLRAWIFRIALNTGRDLRKTAWRRRRKPLNQADATLVAQGDDPGTDATRREQLELREMLEAKQEAS